VQEDELNFKDKLKQILTETIFAQQQSEDSEQIIDQFVYIIQHGLENSKVLKTIQRVQLLDDMDVELVHKVYEMMKHKHSDEYLQTKMFDVFSLEVEEQQKASLGSESTMDAQTTQWVKLLDEDIAAIEAVDFTCMHNRSAQQQDSGEAPAQQAQEHHIHLAHGTAEEVLAKCKESEDFAMHILRRFLLSASAKDCSLMLAFKPVSSGEVEAAANVSASSNEGLVTVPKDISATGTEQHYRYRIGVVDVDPKPISKMQYYFSLDTDIVNHYKKKKQLHHHHNIHNHHHHQYHHHAKQ